MTTGCFRAKPAPRALSALLLAFLWAGRMAMAQDAGRNAVSAGCLTLLGSLSADCQAPQGESDGSTAEAKAPRRVLHSTVPTLKNLPRPAKEPTEGPLAPDDQPLIQEPEEPPTEFQRFAMTSAGEMLPIFGASLFKGVPTTFAPVDRIPVTAEYVVGPGDEILLRLWGQVNADLKLTVDRTGGIFVPQVGRIAVAGLLFGNVAGYLRGQIGRVYRNFDLDVNMGQLRSIQVFVVGQARRPGSYTVSSLSTLLNALFASGGPSRQGSMRHVQLKRGAQVITEFDLYDLLLKGDKSKDQRLLPGDVIYIPVAGPQMALAGSVRTPGVYELKGETSAAGVIEMAGGITSTGDIERATLERIGQYSGRSTSKIQLNADGLSTKVGDGDMLRIPPIAPRFDKVVTLRGNVANPGRFPWHEGMRLRDVIPDKQSLITRQYWEQRNSLAPLAEAKKPQPAGLGVKEPDINWQYAAIERQRERDLSEELIPFNLGKLVLEGDETQNYELRPADVVTVFSQDDMRVAAAQQSRVVRLEGEFVASGVYQARPGETLAQLIQRTGGLTKQAYLYASEFTRESTRADQQRRVEEFVQNLQEELEKGAASRSDNATTAEDAAIVSRQIESERNVLARLKKLKATGRIVLNLEPGVNDLTKLMDLQLENGDQFVVPPKPSTVNILGAVYNQNSFLYDAQFGIGDYLRQAGGGTRTADQARIFVIRADGTVTPKTGFNPLGRSFDARRLNPGDTVVVPEKLFRTSFLRGLRDWSQIIGQLALGAAAVNVLK